VILTRTDIEHQVLKDVSAGAIYGVRLPTVWLSSRQKRKAGPTIKSGLERHYGVQDVEKNSVTQRENYQMINRETFINGGVLRISCQE
jgi:hypothetical protein